jgi:hypothetical protein
VDLSDTIEPKSDQQNFDDYLAGPRTVTISAVTRGTTEQPVNIELAEYPGRPYKPNKSMRRVLVYAWGKDAQEYVGHRMTLVGNPDVVFGGKPVGGIEIAALSHIDKPLTIALTATRGKRKPFTVQPLIESDNPWIALIEKAVDLAELKRTWDDATTAGATRDPAVAAAKNARKKALESDHR